MIYKKEKVIKILPLMIFSLFSIAFSEDLIEEICRRKQKFEEILKKYIQTEERETIISNEKGKVVKKELSFSEIFWSNGKWMRKILKKVSEGIVREPKTLKIEKEDKVLYPFNFGDRTKYKYTIKDNQNFVEIKAELKEKSGKRALEGVFLISKDKNYIEKAFLTLSKFHLILEPIKIVVTYAKVDEDLIAPVLVESETSSKKIFGIRRVVNVRSKFNYIKKEISE